jgi:dipeptide/tripeptide permease
MTAATSEPEAEAPLPKLTFVQTIRTFSRGFWMCSLMEVWERLAYYGVRMVMPVYIAQADAPGGLHWSQQDKATIYIIWTLIQSILPMFTGGYSDRYGYKRTIFVTVWMKILGYVLMATQHTFGGFLTGVVFLASGTALFKPGIQGTLGQSTTKVNASVGWGMFYWLVNVGAAMGPWLAGYLKGHGWPWVFYGCAGIISLNFFMLLTYPEVDSGAEKTRGPWQVMKDTMRNFWDARLIAVILILSGFWLMMYQLWDFMPNFYTDWIDSTEFVKSSDWLPKAWISTKDPRGPQLHQEQVLNLNSLLVVAFLVPFSYLVGRMRVLPAMAAGIFISTLGVLALGRTMGMTTLVIGLVLFSLGEMLTGPKKLEYFALIAPPGKKALYLGYINIPTAVGPAIGAQIVGSVYPKTGERAQLALRYLAEKTDFVKGKGAWDGDMATVAQYVGVKRPDALKTMQEVTGLDASGCTRLLWDTYHPYTIWYWFAAIGVASLVAMMIFARMSRRWKDLDV